MLGVQLPHPLPQEGQIEFGFQMAVEVVAGNKLFERDGNRLVEAAGFRWAEHR
jgi:hypothetical protein